MVFAGTRLAARIESAECRLLSACVEPFLRQNEDHGAFVMSIGGGLAAYTAQGSPMNKVAGIGFNGPMAEGELVQAEDAFAERGAPVQVELSTLAECGIAEMLTRRGYHLLGFENVLGLDPAKERERKPRATIEIEESSMNELDAWCTLVVDGFCHPDDPVEPHEAFSRDVLEKTIREVVRADGLRRFIARLDGVPAGGASMRLTDGIAQMCGAATLPVHRRHGVQTALLEHRLALATQAGCDFAVVTTKPGSKSAENSHRQGFELLYTRAILVKG